MIEYRKVISRQMVQAERDKIFVFGDNMQRAGYGGQAAAMRGEPNAFGVATKRAPTNSPDAFMRDDCRRDFLALSEDLHKLAGLSRLFPLVWPADGIGTGRANLPYYAPKLFRLIEAFRLVIETMPLTKT